TQNYKKAPEWQSHSGGNFILPLRVIHILPVRVNIACPRGSNTLGFSRREGYDAFTEQSQF
ncbi:MAG: hypothetical protein IJT11_04335, partial [Bacteroidaceae bacterium]|nr:hypothetical protein [Bacteroidaceae bacterium]